MTTDTHEAGTWMTPREAAALLGVVERTVLLHIQRGELEGERRGKRWRVSRASVEKHPHFRGRTTPAKPTTTTPPRARTAPTAPRPPSRKSDPASDSIPAPDAALTAPLAPKRPRREWTFRSLTVFCELGALAARTVRAVQGLPEAPREAVELTVRSAMEGARYGAAGFHAFVRSEKVRLYSRAREHVAMTAMSLWILADLGGIHAEGLRLMAHEYEQLAPSLGALMRKAAPADA